jgi:Fe-Mn family superoxide dismutase
MAFDLSPLPYAETALEPYISAQTLGFHHGKHHATYVKVLNDLIAGTPLASASLEDIIKTTAKDDSKKKIFNNAAQVWNHDFFWKSMAPPAGSAPSGALLKALESAFGSVKDFNEAFKTAALGQFGSGWAWLVKKGDTLEITTTGNADLPLVHGQTALVTCDVWEHAYYLDYQNRRADFVEAFLIHLINWDFVAANFEKA